ncbi:MAG: tetratricopeptide repeat protein [Rhizomicrobium sp.]
MASFIRIAAVAAAFIAPAWASDAPSFGAIAAALQAGRAADAEAMATAMLAASDPVPIDNAYLLLDRGLAREQLRRRDEAVKDFTAAIATNTLPQAELSRALFDRGVILDELGRTDEAIEDYSRAILLSPRYAEALNNRGNAYRRLERYAEARADYQAALTAGDDEPEYPLYGLGRIAEAQGDPVAAKAYYERSLAANGLFTPASRQIALLGPADPNYALHAPDATSAAATKPKPAQTDVRKPVPTAETTGDTVGLRPAILGPQVAKNQKPVRVASIAPELSQASTESSHTLVQLGAWRSKSDAALGWDHAAASADNLLSGATPHIVEADIPGKGHFFRLRTHAPAGTSAEDYCSQLRAKGLNCIPVRS